MPINKTRFVMDMQIAEEKYGKHNIKWAADYSWIRVDDFELPENFKQTHTNILILVPANYGYGGCYRDIFINNGLELLSKDGNFYEKLGTHLHYYEKFPYPWMTEEKKKEIKDKQWGYLCLHDQNPNSGLVNYLYKADLFLGNIHKEWKKIYEGYRK